MKDSSDMSVMSKEWRGPPQVTLVTLRAKIRILITLVIMI